MVDFIQYEGDFEVMHQQCNTSTDWAKLRKKAKLNDTKCSTIKGWPTGVTIMYAEVSISTSYSIKRSV